MSGIDERPVKKTVVKGVIIERESIDAQRIHNIIRDLAGGGHESEYHGTSPILIIAEIVVGFSCLLGGILHLVVTVDPWSFVFIVLGAMMLNWGMNDREGYVNWVDRQNRRYLTSMHNAHLGHIRRRWEHIERKRRNA